ncbi:hypothetical protein [Novosphingobium sp.]|nr:hypothetical protein [Novosphingobium sp.]MCC6926264.1 hypothetical protein [Novosphingobium sp.]
MTSIDINEIPHLDTNVICSDPGIAEDSVAHPALISLMLLFSIVIR